jgi:hypothetical protein
LWNLSSPGGFSHAIRFFWVNTVSACGGYE